MRIAPAISMRALQSCRRFMIKVGPPDFEALVSFAKKLAEDGDSLWIPLNTFSRSEIFLGFHSDKELVGVAGIEMQGRTPKLYIIIRKEFRRIERRQDTT